MALTVSLGEGRAAFEASVTGFVRAVSSASEWDLLGASRCHGWTRLDVAVHVLAGWQEMLAGFVDVVDTAPTVDAASYWTGFADLVAGDDPVDVLMAQRRRGAAYARPVVLLEQLREVADSVLTAARTMRAQPCRWQGVVFTPGDFLAVWAVEDVVHHLDLTLGAPPAGGLALARATVDALSATPLPADWPDERVVLVGCGREAGPEGMPVLG